MSPKQSVREREEGILLLELIMAITVLTMGILGFLTAFHASLKAGHELGSRDQAQASLESVIETLNAADFSTLYATYEGATFPVDGLVDSAGNPAVIRVNFHVNETTMLSEYGPIGDIDGDGAMSTLDASTSYVILPARLTLSYEMTHGTENKEMFLVLGSSW